MIASPDSPELAGAAGVRIHAPVAEFQPLFGVYKGGPNELALFAHDGMLFMKLGDAPATPVYTATAAAGRFFVVGTPYSFSIATDGAGKHVMTVYPQGATASPNKKIWDRPVPAEPPPANVPK